VEYVTTQLSSFLILLFTGVLLGAFFDFYRVLRGVVRADTLFTMVGDLLFWLGAFVWAAPLIYWSTWLELRLYVWVALLLGILLYFPVFSSLLIPLYLRFWRTVTWLPRQLFLLVQKAGVLMKRGCGRKRWKGSPKNIIE
jgi:spore cortex biosynthesis protein YabQ